MAPEEFEPSTERCPTCGDPIPRNVLGGLCPRCLLVGSFVAPVASVKPDDAQPGHPTRDEVVRLFPELEIGELIGSGGMGVVYQARQPRLDRQVALKILSCPAEHHDGFALRFQREAQTLARLNHPHIVTIHDFGEREEVFYFLMEFVDGADLSEVIAGGELAPEEALRIVPQICEGLQYAHDRGITHRDIKPANILINRSGQVKLADFGLAKMIGGNEMLASGLTLTGSSMGTPHYMAPEQWENPGEVDHRADIYSLGVVFYEMLTGERPIGVFKAPSQKSPVDKRLDTIVLHAMERAPEDRYQQASEVKNDVTQVLSCPPPAAIRVTGRIRLWAGLAAVAVVLGLITWIGAPAGRPKDGEARKPAVATAPGPRGSKWNPSNTSPFRLVIEPTSEHARARNPGAPWDVSLDNLIDLQRNISAFGPGGIPVAGQGVTAALTADGRLLSWVNQFKSATIVPPSLADAKVADFSIGSDGMLAAALLSSGEVWAWTWKFDPDHATVRVEEPFRIEFPYPESPVEVSAGDSHAVPFVIARFPDGRISYYPELSPYAPVDAGSMRGVHSIEGEYVLLDNGAVQRVAKREQEWLEGTEPLPTRGIRRFFYHFPLHASLLEDGRLTCSIEKQTYYYHWIEREKILREVYARAARKAPVVDFTACRVGTSRFAVKNANGDWFVSDGALDESQRERLNGAAVVYRDPDYVIGLMPTNASSDPKKN